jgi:hypothetical protein
MKSVSAVVTYDSSTLRVIDVRSPDEPSRNSAGGSAGFYDTFTLNDAAFTVNFGDTNAVTVSLVWPEPQQLPQEVTAIALLYVEVLLSVYFRCCLFLHYLMLRCFILCHIFSLTRLHFTDLKG